MWSSTWCKKTTRWWTWSLKLGERGCLACSRKYDKITIKKILKEKTFKSKKLSPRKRKSSSPLLTTASWRNPRAGIKQLICSSTVPILITRSHYHFWKPTWDFCPLLHCFVQKRQFSSDGPPRPAQCDQGVECKAPSKRWACPADTYLLAQKSRHWTIIKCFHKLALSWAGYMHISFLLKHHSCSFIFEQYQYPALSDL